jgi:Sulfotransferase domain
VRRRTIYGDGVHKTIAMPIERAVEEEQTDAIRLLKQRLSNFETHEGRNQGLAYIPRPNDVAISTTPKAGTTWAQQICHQIRCGLISPENCMDFEEISEVVPWIELAADIGQDLRADQPPVFDAGNVPRLFKTHCWHDHCPRFPKTIVVLRDPFDVVVSFYNFFEGWFFEPGSIDIATFTREFWLARGVPESKMENASYFVHLTTWYVNRHGSDSTKVLIVCFEDLKDDLQYQVRRIAKFLSNEHYSFDRDDVIEHALKYSSFSFMKENEYYFDEKLTKLGRNEACGLPKDAGMAKTKISRGSSDVGSTSLSEELRSEIQAKWDEVVLPVTGCRNYNELRQKLAQKVTELG